MKNLIYLFLIVPFFVCAQGIGINTTSPQAKLHVAGDLKFLPKPVTPTRMVGVIASGEVKDFKLGPTFAIEDGVLNVYPSIDPNIFLIGDVDQSATAASISQYDNLDIGLEGDNRDKTIIRINGETNGFNVTGFDGGYDGRIIYFYNSQSHNVTFFNLNGASDTENQIITGSGSNEGINGEGVAEFIYDASLEKWILVNIRS